jgi:hypothetical protein
MAGQITLTEQEARALSSLLDRASERLATYEEQTHQDRRLAEEIRGCTALDDPNNSSGVKRRSLGLVALNAGPAQANSGAII